MNSYTLCPCSDWPTHLDLYAAAGGPTASPRCCQCTLALWGAVDGGCDVSCCCNGCGGDACNAQVHTPSSFSNKCPPRKRTKRADTHSMNAHPENHAFPHLLQTRPIPARFNCPRPRPHLAGRVPQTPPWPQQHSSARPGPCWHPSRTHHGCCCCRLSR